MSDIDTAEVRDYAHESAGDHDEQALRELRAAIQEADRRVYAEIAAGR